jgi:general secretion pathway protein E
MHGEYTTEEVLGVLVSAGLIAPEVARDARVREPAERARVLKARLGSPAGRSAAYRVSAPESLASLKLKRADGQVLTEDAIMQALAAAADLPWRRLDPVDLDLDLVTRTLSRPFARRHVCLAIGDQDGALVVAMAEPRDVELRESLQRITQRAIQPVVASKSDILRIIGEFYGFKSTIAAAEREYGRAAGIENLEQLFRIKSDAELEATDQHIVKAVDYLLRHAMEQRASDIHFEPKRDDALVRYRIDGMLHTVHTLPRAVAPPLVSRLKMMARMDIAERRRPQDGRIKTVREGREVEMRVSTMPTAFGEKVVLRIFDPDLFLLDLSALGFFEHQRTQWFELAARPHGILLVTGPTGSGKTTTLYSTLKTLACPEVNIVTIEDPIEVVTPAFNQVAVNPKVEVTFASALRTVLRQDPDIIMVGEIRDAETARYAVQAALTGHLVLSTLHTNDAAGAFTRLIDLGVEPFLLSSTVVGVAAQRLIRKVCEHCARPAHLGADELRMLGIARADDEPPLPVREGEGCVECRGTGYLGRTSLFELLPVTPAVRQAVHGAADAAALARIARREGMMTLQEAALKKLALGVTSFPEVVRVVSGG